ncbi:MAG: DUF3291 domain-containing protein [Pseudomonadota bacterium]
MSKQWHLAQINVGTIKYPQDDPRMSGFMNRLDEINALAESSAGFVWRLQDDSGNATNIDVGKEPLFIVNMSVWESAESLFEYVYKSMHREVMIQRRNWFERPADLYQALWWIPAGHLPAPEEGLAKIELLKQLGPTQEAFNFKKRFPCPGANTPSENDLDPSEFCSGWE